MRGSVLLIACVSLVPRLTGQVWTRVPGCARDVAVGPKGEVWIVGCSDAGPGGSSIHRWTGSGWEKVSGAGVRIAAGGPGPWLVNRDGAIYERRGDEWVKRPGCARDIGIGNDYPWIIGCSENQYRPGGSPIYDWQGSDWHESDRDGRGIRIAAGPDHVPWVVNQQGSIYRRTLVRVGPTANDAYGGERVEWEQIPGCARDIAVDGLGAPWIVGCSSAPGGSTIHHWTGAAWERVEGGGVAIAAGAGGPVWVVNAQGDIFRGVGGGTQAPPTSPPPVFTIELETLLPSAQVSSGPRPVVQAMTAFGGAWGHGAQLFWPAAQTDAVLRLEPWVFLPPFGGRYEVRLFFTRAPDYGSITVYMDDDQQGHFSLGSSPTVTLDNLSLGVVQLSPGPHRLRVKVHGNASHTFAGLDRLEFRRQP